MVKKGEKEKNYIEVLKKHPKGLTKIEIRNKAGGMKTSTEHDITKRFLARNIIGEDETWDEKRNKLVKKYYLLAYKDLADPDELKWLMETYKKAYLNNDKIKIQQLQRDIENICAYKKIRDKDFIEFLVEEVQKTDDKTRILRRCLGHVSTNLLKAIETEEESLELFSRYHEKHLITILHNSVDDLVKIIFDKKRPVWERDEALYILKQFDHPKKFDVAFELLKNGEAFNLRQESSSFERTTKDLILLYGNINRTDCRKKLYNLLTLEKDESIKNEVIGLLERIRSGYKDAESVYYERRSPRDNNEKR